MSARVTVCACASLWLGAHVSALPVSASVACTGRDRVCARERASPPRTHSFIFFVPRLHFRNRFRGEPPVRPAAARRLLGAQRPSGRTRPLAAGLASPASPRRGPRGRQDAEAGGSGHCRRAGLRRLPAAAPADRSARLWPTARACAPVGDPGQESLRSCWEFPSRPPPPRVAEPVAPARTQNPRDTGPPGPELGSHLPAMPAPPAICPLLARDLLSSTREAFPRRFSDF